MIDYDPHRWWSHFFDIRGSMVREIAYRLALCALIAIGVSFAYHYHADVAINDKPHVLIAPALSLLLVFRTNSANDRFIEGRRLWGGITNASRNLRRKARLLLAAEPHTVDEIVEWTIAFAWATAGRLNGNKKQLGPKPHLADGDRESVLLASSPPSAVASRITRILVDARQRGVITDIQLQMMDADVQALIDHLGGCERILTTPLPFAYAVHLRRALVLYCGSLPFALVNTFHEWTVLVSIVVTYILIGIEEIGTEIENPFEGGANDLPLERICTNIQNQLRDASNAP